MPSYIEWQAFAGNLGITANTTCADYGLSRSYWTSSHARYGLSDGNAYIVFFIDSRMAEFYVINNELVRLARSY